MTLLLGDCIERMRELEPDSIDAVVCDPPYGIGFMGHDWDQPDRRVTDREGTPSGQRRASQPAPSGFDLEGNGAKEAGRYDLSRSANQTFQKWCEEWATEAFRILKPGGHLLAFGGTRTYHRLAAGVEDAGFEIRDNIAWSHMTHVFCQCDAAGGRPPSGSPDDEQRTGEPGTLAVEWIAQGGGAWPGCPRCGKPLAPPFFGGPLAWKFGSGFPKSLDVSKALDARAGVAREVVGNTSERSGRTQGAGTSEGYHGGIVSGHARDITEPATDEAKRWAGWGTALKPALEPIVVARKPFKGTVAGNVLEHGTGAVNVDGCRIPLDAEETFDGGRLAPTSRADGWDRPWKNDPEAIEEMQARRRESIEKAETLGRWPANVILDPAAAEMLDAQTGELSTHGGRNVRGAAGDGWGFASQPGVAVAPDAGGASRFFYCAKTSSAERNAGLGAFDAQPAGSIEGTPMLNSSGEYPTHRNVHPTVKPIALMRWLIRLVTPPGGTILDPFLGSGTTGCAAALEGMTFVGIEREPDYIAIAEARIAFWAEHGDDALRQVATRESAERQRAELADAGQLDIFQGA